MKLKGTMVIELTDTHTGNVETITEENMVTNVVNHLLGINPMAAMYNAAGEYDGQMIWNNEMLPICPNMIGGILLFPKAIPAIGSYKYESYPTRTKMAVVRNGYLHIPAYDKTGIYKISLSNSTDVTKIDFGFTSEMKPLGGSGNCENYLVLIGDLIIGWDFQIRVNDTVIRTAGAARLEEICTAVFQYKEYIFFWSSSYLNQYRMTYILTPYLATINNLSQAVVKNADKTMKITYTLTEQE